MTILERITKLYRDNFNSTTHGTHRDVLNELAGIPVKTIEADYNLSDDDRGYCIQSLSDDPVIVRIPSDISEGFFCTLERLGSGSFEFRGNGFTINGVEDLSISIENQWNSVYVRVYGPTRAKVEGSFLQN
ncbi:hypothetical protein [Croceimicrobium hydrocarbonivorans]|uniref:Uncharacterized protein n=1 Tax=Croceimicrobium hydrocarbonivorans TaxID=2761580 RepID=A0A7H0VBB1_9FLAO|nr:hypothetical protein [Croceimicrobium hydrocarbonivorans]QNR22965.1 hypothetical protein H4K34_11305 [Croceimicrobium hydrocarbonivorans]QNR23009.1 hypothetical protein H4K34_11525 [Croceimicrobium hydrocarbonivorans]